MITRLRFRAAAQSHKRRACVESRNLTTGRQDAGKQGVKAKGRVNGSGWGSAKLTPEADLSLAENAVEASTKLQNHGTTRQHGDHLHTTFPIQHNQLSLQTMRFAILPSHPTTAPAGSRKKEILPARPTPSTSITR
jgi:hypothetical protein